MKVRVLVVLLIALAAGAASYLCLRRPAEPADPLAVANAKYDEGMRLYRRSWVGTGDFFSLPEDARNRILREAEARLEEAITLYDRALERAPNNGTAQDRQAEANMIMYSCKKHRSL
jgi:hypothetical protein